MAENNVGNVAEMRKALVEIDKNTDLLDIAEDVAPNIHPSHSFVAVQIRKIIRDALAASPRNCDVGTIEEQLQRFEAYCSAHEPCESCPLDRPRATPSCGVHWSQLPYEEGAGKC